MASNILGTEWSISSEGLNLITNNGNLKEKSKILQNVLDTDLKEIGAAILDSQLSKDKVTKVVLQIQKIRNISAPKANQSSQAAPRMLKLILTDGVSIAQALEISSVPSLNLDKTPPGSKLLINGAKIASGYILINSNNCTLLGGKVPHLIEKWEVSKSFNNNKRQSSTTDGPPAWVNFGSKIQSMQADQNFKSMGNDDKVNKDNTEFELQRKDAITEAASGAIKKVFGGGVRQNVQPVNNSIVPNRNNPNEREKYNSRGKSNRFNKNAPSDFEEMPQKPLEKVSLFAFLEDKLPINENQISTAKSTIVDTYKSARADYSDNKPTNNYVKKNQHNNYNSNQFQQNNFNQPQYQHNNYNPQYQQNDKSNYNTKPRYEKFDVASSGNNSYPKQNKTTQKSSLTNSETALSNDLGKLSINNQFASRSLRQHLNLGPSKKEDRTKNNEDRSHKSYEDKGYRNNEERIYKNYEDKKVRSNDDKNVKSNGSISLPAWNVGHECLAKYWEDGKYYNAVVTAVTDKTYVVKFKGYGNLEEILKTDCLAVDNKQNSKFPPKKYDQNKSHSGTLEFRRGGAIFKSNSSNSYSK